MIWTGVSEMRWWARKGYAGHGAAEEEEGARAKERRPAPEEGLLPRTADAKLTGLREAPEAAEAWLPSECLKMLTGEDGWRG